MNIPLLCAVGVSTAAVAVLAWRDPKRLRSDSKGCPGGRLPTPLTSRVRKLLCAAMMLPGITLVVMKAWIAFLVWFGATCLAGWLVAQALGQSEAARQQE